MLLWGNDGHLDVVERVGSSHGDNLAEFGVQGVAVKLENGGFGRFKPFRRSEESRGSKGVPRSRASIARLW